MEVKDLVLSLKNYLRISPMQIQVIGRFIDLLDTPGLTSRNQFPAHLTASAWLTNSKRTEALLIYHPKLHKWIQPGGHFEPGENIEQACRRELMEETGYSEVQWQHDSIMDLDIHQIPALGVEPEHEHYDVRLWFIAEPDQAVESNAGHQLEWMSLHEIEQNISEESVLRMARKTMEYQN